MADHQNRAARLLPYGFDLAVKGCRTQLIETLRRFIQQNDVRSADQRACKQHPLKLATGERCNLLFGEVRKPGYFKRGSASRLRHPIRQSHEAFDRDRQRWINVQLLRDVSDPKAPLTHNLTGRRCDRAYDSFEKAGFA